MGGSPPIRPLLTDRIPEVFFSPILIAIFVFLGFLVIGFLVGRWSVRVLDSLGVPEMVEGTTFERSTQGLGSSTVAVMGRLISWFIYGVGALVALHIAGVLDADAFWQQATIFVPQLFVAVLVVIVGIVVGEKVGLLLAEQVRGVKLPEVTLVAPLVKYSIIFLAVLIALSQIGVVTTALIVILAAYAFGVVFLTGIACKDLLTSGASGIYLLLHQPYSIGDEIRVGERTGIVQEIDLFITRIESDEAEYVIPNRELFLTGVALVS